MIEEPIRLTAYNPAWPALFRGECTLLDKVLAPWLAGPIEHIGSTAVPGLIAKPTIDIMAGVHDLASSVDARPILLDLGYLYFPYRPDVMHWFCKPSLQERKYHLHLVPAGSALWTERLAFRDFLRQSPDAAAEYAALKAGLAAKYPTDREAYTAAKTDFVNAIVQRARRI